jgi:chromosome segregation ATPase
MLSEEQIKKLLSLNESLQIQLEDVTRVLAARDKEIEFLQTELAEATALRSKMDGQQDEIENFHYLLYKKEQLASGAVERETGLQQELTELARLNNTYNELLQDYTYLSSRFTDAQARLTALNERNFELQQVAGRIGEMESSLENNKIEREELKNKPSPLELQKYLKEFNL